MVAADSPSSRWRFLSRLGVPLLVLVAGIVCTVLAVLQLSEMGERAERQRFETLASERTDQIADRIETYLALLRGAGGLFAASDDVTAAEFKAYTRRLRLGDFYGGLQGIGYASAIPSTQRGAWEEEMRARGVLIPTIRPDEPRDFYTSIAFLEPEDARNRAALGFDMFTEPTRRAAMERARDTGRRAASGRVVLAQEIAGEKQFGFLIYLPVYRVPGGVVPATVDERRSTLRGWVYIPFRAGDFLTRALDLRGRTAEAAIAVYDGEPGNATALLFASAPARSDQAASYVATRTLDVGDRQWTVVFTSDETFLPDSNHALVPFVAAGGLLTTFILFGAALTQSRATAEAHKTREQIQEMNASLEERVEERTAQLESARSAMESLNANLEKIVEARTSDLTAANDEIQRFAYIVSHDLRSPLVNVMGFTSELQVALETISRFYANVTEKLPEAVDADTKLAIETDLPEAIGFIRSSTSKMDRLINAILRLSRQGGQILTPERLDLRAMLLATADTLAHQANEAGAEIIIEDVPEVISDRLAIDQIFSNLLGNAVKYLAPERAGQIRVRGWEEGATVFIDIEDNGRGIDPKDHDRVFELFRRAGVQDRPGEGIGLAHVRALVRRLGGKITLNSALGEGSTFRVAIPKVMTKKNEGGQ